MRLAILSLFLSVGMMAYGQSTASGSASLDKEWKGLSSISTDFDELPPRWQAGIRDPANTFTPPGTSFFWQGEEAQSDSKMRFHLPQLGNAAALDAQLFAQSVDPSRPNILSQWLNLKIEPIPTQWPNAKLEPIPTQWADLKLLPIATRSSNPSALQDPSKWSTWNFPH